MEPNVCFHEFGFGYEKIVEAKMVPGYLTYATEKQATTTN